MDMSKHTKDAPQSLLHCPKCNGEYPAQGRERYVHIVDVIRENQPEVSDILRELLIGSESLARKYIHNMHKSDRDALLQSGGILNDAQIELLK